MGLKLRSTKLKVTAAIVIALGLVGALVWSGFHVPEAQNDMQVSPTQSTLSHAFKYETLTKMSKLPKQEPDAPYDGYSHGLSSGIESDDPEFSTYVGKNVAFSKESGAYAEPFSLSLKAPEGYEIYYTTDGSEPSQASPHYDGPISVTDADGQERLLSSQSSIDAMTNYDFNSFYFIPDQSKLARATIIKAKAFTAMGRSTETVTKTYFVGKSIAERYGGIAVMSLTTDPAGLLDYNTGIMASGKIYDEWRTTPEAQASIANNMTWTAIGNYSMRGSDWEREAAMQLFDGEDSLSYSADVGIRIRGGTSRVNAQKSLNVYFRKDYGQKYMDYELFDSCFDANGTVIGEYRSFMLRNGGTEAGVGIKFRDSYLQSLLAGMDFATQSSRPCVVFLNGEYWGVYTLSERYCDDQLAAEYGVDKDNVVVIKDGLLDEGIDSDVSLYEDLLEYADKDLSDRATWDEFCQLVDVQSMADYFAAEVYIGNADWSQVWNYSLWRTRTAENNQYGDGRWRWMMYDTEFSTAMVPHDGDNVLVDYDHFSVALKNNALFASAMDNPDFRTMFRSSLATIATNKFDYGRAMSRLMDYIDVWEPLMADHYLRYGDFGRNVYRRAISSLADYIENRGDIILGIVDEAYADYDAFKLRVLSEQAGIEELTPSDAPEPDFGTEALEEPQMTSEMSQLEDELHATVEERRTESEEQSYPESQPESQSPELWDEVDENGNYAREITG